MANIEELITTAVEHSNLAAQKAAKTKGPERAERVAYVEGMHAVLMVMSPYVYFKEDPAYAPTLAVYQKGA